MKKFCLILTAFLLLLSAGCAKKAANEPSDAQSQTLQAVTSGEDIEVTLFFESEESTTAAAGQTDSATQADGNQSAPSMSQTAPGSQTTLAAAKGDEAATGASEATTGASASATAPGTTATAPGTTAAATDKPHQTVPLSDSASGSTKATSPSSAPDISASTAVRGKDRYELPAIPLN